MKQIKFFIAGIALLSTSLLLSSCGSSTPTDTIVVGASPTPHADILEAARGEIEARGYKLKIREFSDYILPNLSLEHGELDANYFQHLPYLLDFNANNKTDLVSAAAIHFEPLGIYPGKKSSLEAISAGDTIAIPNDNTNAGRALLLLHTQGIIELEDESKGFATTLDDIANSNGIKIREVEAAIIPSILDDVAYGVVNGNYALAASIADQALVTEGVDSLASSENANIIAIRRGEEESKKTKVLVEALTSNTVRDYINETYGASVIPVF